MSIEPLSVYRHEMKYFISKRDSVLLSQLLEKTMTPDKYSMEGGEYWIRSLYFDTFSNQDYYTKIDGYSERKKLRLRIYNLDQTVVKLEIKHKYGDYMFKESCTISKEDALLLTKGDFSHLRSYQTSTADKVYALAHSSLYKPTVLIDYERTAFLYPFQNIRITIDKNVRTSSRTQEFFESNLCMTPIFTSDIYILEIKYSQMLPTFLQRLLSNFIAQKSSISKYCLSRQIINY